MAIDSQIGVTRNIPRQCPKYAGSILVFLFDEWCHENCGDFYWKLCDLSTNEMFCWACSSSQPQEEKWKISDWTWIGKLNCLEWTELFLECWNWIIGQSFKHPCISLEGRNKIIRYLPEKIPNFLHEFKGDDFPSLQLPPLLSDRSHLDVPLTATPHGNINMQKYVIIHHNEYWSMFHFSVSRCDAGWGTHQNFRDLAGDHTIHDGHQRLQCWPFKFPNMTFPNMTWI